MGKIDNSTLHRIGQEKASLMYGLDASIDEGINALQVMTLETIGKAYPVLEVVQSFLTPPNFFYFVKLKTGHLIKFKIDEHGLFTLKTVPVWCGVNTPYHIPVTKIGDEQIKLL